MPLRAALVATVLVFPALAFAQAQPAAVTSVKGKFQDPITRAAVPEVAVKMTSLADTSDVYHVTAKEDGSFEVPALGVHSYRLEATRLGYAPLKMVVRVSTKNQDLGVLAMTTESVPVSGITVHESPPPAIQKGDTTEFHAGAVKIGRDANAEDLVQKLPGVTMENGQVKAQGEAVQNVLVNGKPFFGSDPTAAMRNLPAEVVDRIQVYDKASDQSEFSGFDDGQSQKTMNFILRNQNTKFGKVYAGYGDQDRYQAGGNATVIHGGQRITAIGLSNNINQRNFSPLDLFGAMSGINLGGGGPRIMQMMGGGGSGGRGMSMMFRGGGFSGGGFDPSSFLVGGQSGVSTTNSGGINYVNQWGPKVSLTASTFLNGTDNKDVQTVARQYLPPQDSLAYYDQGSTANSTNENERADVRLEWSPDSSNSVIVQPRLYFSRNDASSVGGASNVTTEGSTISGVQSSTFDGVHGNNLSNRLTLRHRFERRGRNISADISLGHSVRNGNGSQASITDFYQGANTVGSDTLDQRSNSRTETNSFSTRIAYTEPLTKSLQAQLIYNPSITKSDADARGMLLDPQTGEYTLPDTALTNTYHNRNTTQNGGLAVLYTRGTWRWLTNASYQHLDIRSDEAFPFVTSLDHAFDDFLPSMTLSGTFANRRNLRLAWTTSAGPPSVGQLQNVVNNSNPLSLTSGNPSLRPNYSNTISLRVSEANPLQSRSRFLFANVTRTSHTIANATFTAPSDTVVDGVNLARGTQLTRPLNLGESWNANLFGVYSRPASFLKSILSFNGGGSFTRTPTRVNGVTNVGSTYVLRSGVVMASNISENLDFTVSYQGTYNISRYTMSTSNRGDYYTHTIGVRFNAVAAHGVVVREELTNNLQSGVPSAYGQDVVLWNTTLGKKFLKDQRGELRVTASDVLRQNQSVSRSVTETYVQDSRDLTLSRYVQAVFTYSFK
ncbi:MAG: TonB-dependent receptor [Candidatus Eisenbacteria bacterium]|nr:TonB-dependent receptor [Candidatus Eisenbacteria bacterium]